MITLEQAREFAEFHLGDLEYGERILIMRKGNEFVVTDDYGTYKNEGYEVYKSYYNI